MRGKPVLGAISGIFFGAFLALFLQQWAIYPLTPLSVFALPILGLILGLLLAAWAPFGRSTADHFRSPGADSIEQPPGPSSSA